MSPAGFLALALLSPGTPPDAPPLPARGDELTYTGTVTESVDRPGRRFRRAHDLEVRVLTLDRRDGAADLAVLTLLRRADDGAVTGARPGPPAARLDLVRTGWNGPRRTTALLAPGAGLPLALGPSAPTRCRNRRRVVSRAAPRATRSAAWPSDSDIYTPAFSTAPFVARAAPA